MSIDKYFGIVGQVGRATARNALCRGFDLCLHHPQGVAGDFGSEQSGWSIDQLASFIHSSVRLQLYGAVVGRLQRGPRPSAARATRALITVEAQPLQPRSTSRLVTLQGVARFAARPASQSRHPRAGSDGRTDPLRHRRLCTGSPSRAASHPRTAGPWDNSCPQPVSGAVAVRYLGADMC